MLAETYPILIKIYLKFRYNLGIQHKIVWRGPFSVMLANFCSARLWYNRNLSTTAEKKNNPSWSVKKDDTKCLCQLIKLYRLAHINKHMRHMCDEILLFNGRVPRSVLSSWRAEKRKKFIFRARSHQQQQWRHKKTANSSFPASSDNVIDNVTEQLNDKVFFLSFSFVISVFFGHTTCSVSKTLHGWMDGWLSLLKDATEFEITQHRTSVEDFQRFSLLPSSAHLRNPLDYHSSAAASDGDSNGFLKISVEKH